VIALALVPKKTTNHNCQSQVWSYDSAIKYCDGDSYLLHSDSYEAGWRWHQLHDWRQQQWTLWHVHLVSPYWTKLFCPQFRGSTSNQDHWNSILQKTKFPQPKQSIHADTILAPTPYPNFWILAGAVAPPLRKLQKSMTNIWRKSDIVTTKALLLYKASWDQNVPE